MDSTRREAKWMRAGALLVAGAAALGVAAVALPSKQTAGGAGAGPTSLYASSCLDTSSPVLFGYDLVAYFSMDSDSDGVLGSVKHHSTFGDDEYTYTFYFSTSENKALFDADPTAYLPQFGGFCSWGIAEEDFWDKKNMGPSADPNVWSIIDGKLYFFMFDTPQSKFMDGDTSEYIAEGEKRWLNWYNGSAAFNTGCSWWDATSDSGVVKSPYFEGSDLPEPEEATPSADSADSADGTDSADSDQAANIAKAKKAKKETKENNENDDGDDSSSSTKTGIVGRGNGSSSKKATSATEDTEDVDTDTAMGRGEEGRENHQNNYPTEVADKPRSIDLSPGAIDPRNTRQYNADSAPPATRPDSDDHPVLDTGSAVEPMPLSHTDDESCGKGCTQSSTSSSGTSSTVGSGSSGTIGADGNIVSSTADSNTAMGRGEEGRENHAKNYPHEVADKGPVSISMK